MGVTAHPTTLGTIMQTFYAEADDAKRAAEAYPIGSEGRELLGTLARTIGRMGTRFEAASDWGGSRTRLRNLILADIQLFAYGEDKKDHHPERDKLFARQQLLVDRLALHRLDAVEAVGR